MLWLKQSTAVTIKFGPFLDETDGKTAETGLTISQADIRLSKNGGDIAQSNNSAGATHDELGFYDVPLDTTDTNTLGTLLVAVHESGALPVWQTFMVVPANVWDSMFGSDKLQVDAVEISSDSAAADNLETAADGGSYNLGGGGVVAASVTGSVGSLAAQAKADVNAEVDSALDTAIPGSPTANSINERVKTMDDADIPGRLPAALTGAGNIKADALVVSDKTGYGLSAAAVQAVWDALTSALTTVGSIGKRLADNVDAAVSSRSSHSAADVWASATRTLTSFGTLASDVWAVATRTLSSEGVQAIWDALTSALTTVGSIGKRLADNVDAAVSSRSSHSAADVWASGTRTLTSFGTLVADIWAYSTRTLTALGTSLVQEVWDRATSALTTVGSIGKLLVDNINATISSRSSQASVDSISASAIADQVWDEASADHNAAGSMGNKMNSAASAGDPWGTALPGAYVSGTGGNILGNLLANIWAYATRTLTQSASQVAAAVAGSTITVRRGDRWVISLTGIGSLTGRTKLWFTAKKGTGDADTAAMVMVVEGAGGLVYFNGASGTVADGSLTVTDAAAGNITITIEASSTKNIPTITSGVYDVQKLDADGKPSTLVEGIFNAVPDITQAVA